jgi:hypothetical protein
VHGTDFGLAAEGVIKRLNEALSRGSHYREECHITQGDDRGCPSVRRVGAISTTGRTGGMRKAPSRGRRVEFDVRRTWVFRPRDLDMIRDGLSDRDFVSSHGGQP